MDNNKGSESETENKYNYNVEACQIAVSAFLTGPVTWPLARILLARQQGQHNFKFSALFATHGFRRAYAGCGPYSFYKLLGIGIQRGVQSPVLFALQHESSEDSYLKSNAWLRYIIAGAVSGVIGGLIVTPMEQLRISRANNDFSTGRDALFFFLNEPKVLLAGARITMYRNVLFDAVNCAMYYSIIDAGYVNMLNPFQMGLVNAVAGVVTAVIDYPLDVLKTRIQSSAVAAVGSKSSSKNIIFTPLALARHIVLNEGLHALYGGLRHKLGLYFTVWGVYGAMFSVVGNIINKVQLERSRTN